MFTLPTRPSRPSEVRKPLFRRMFLLALIPAVILAGRIAKSEVVHVSTAEGSDWTITITPAAKSAPVVPHAAMPTALPAPSPPLVSRQSVPVSAPAAENPSPPVAEEPLVPAVSTENGVVIAPNPSPAPQVSAYKAIYDAIPFNRTEYLANPSYRQEMAMELLTGHQRQIVVHRNYTPQLNEPLPRHPLFLYNRYGFHGAGLGYGAFPYGHGFGINHYPGHPPAYRFFLPLENLY